jgi:hypothetical protein
VNGNQTTPPRKPYFVSDAEWAAALRASQISLFDYVFLTGRLLYGFSALFLTMFTSALQSAHWDFSTAFSRTVHNNLFLGLSAFLLFIGVARAFDWRGKRKLVFRKPVDMPNKNPNATNAEPFAEPGAVRRR